VACSTAYKWVTASTGEIRPKVTLVNKCANTPVRKTFLCQFRIYLHEIIKIKLHYVSRHSLKLFAWQYYVILDYGSQICNGFDIYCSNCITFFTYVTRLDMGCIKSEFLYFNSSSTPCSWWRSEMVPVPIKALKIVPPKSNRLSRLSNQGKKDGNNKFWTPRFAEMFQSVSNRKLKWILFLDVQQWIRLF